MPRSDAYDSTSNFGVSTCEFHDSTPFRRSLPGGPELSSDNHVPQPLPVAQPFVHGDARDMSGIPDSSVALVVTSPPYFAGKAYEEALERRASHGVPRVPARCSRTSSPSASGTSNRAAASPSTSPTSVGSRIGPVRRRHGHPPGRPRPAPPRRSLWAKAEGATGSCAWGSFSSAANPSSGTPPSESSGQQGPLRPCSLARN